MNRKVEIIQWDFKREEIRVVMRKGRKAINQTVVFCFMT